MTDRTDSTTDRSYLERLRLLNLESNERNCLLAHYQGFCDGTQHDHLSLSWDGTSRDAGVRYMQERMRPAGFVPVQVAAGASDRQPASKRKPDCPVPLGTQIVSRFTEMLFGAGRSPTIRAPASPETQEYLACAFEESDLWDCMAQARDVAGACGSVAIHIGVRNQQLFSEVLHPKDLWVAEWCADAAGWTPMVVVEQKLVCTHQMNAETGHLEEVKLWHTRAWTDEYSITYVPVADLEDGEVLQVQSKVEHKLGACPVVWYQNTRNTSSPDGEPDCDKTWPLLDKLDRLQSQVFKAAFANTDPTLVHKEDPQQARHVSKVLRKGGNSAINLLPVGDVKYLEISGTTVTAALGVEQLLIEEILQTTECVILTPENASAYQSGEALQLMWRSMESKANRYRVTAARAIKELCWILLKIANVYGVADATDVKSRASGILLPPRKVVTKDAPPASEEPVVGQPQPPETEIVTYQAHAPEHEWTYICVDWPSYWSATPAQIQSTAVALSAATTSKQILSSATATRYLSRMLGQDPDEETKAVAKERADGANMLLSAMAEGLGGVDDDDTDDDSEDGQTTPPNKVAPFGKAEAPDDTPEDDES